MVEGDIHETFEDNAAMITNECESDAEEMQAKCQNLLDNVDLTRVGAFSSKSYTPMSANTH